jgi:cell division protein FtsA
MKRTKVAAIDVGTTKVCTIMGDLDSEGALRVLGVGIGPSQGLQKGLVVNVNEAKEIQARIGLHRRYRAPY